MLTKHTYIYIYRYLCVDEYIKQTIMLPLTSILKTNKLTPGGWPNAYD